MPWIMIDADAKFRADFDDPDVYLESVVVAGRVFTKEQWRDVAVILWNKFTDSDFESAWAEAVSAKRRRRAH